MSGLFDKLFNKSQSELDKIEGGEQQVEEAAPAEPAMPVNEEFEALLDASPISARRYLEENKDNISPQEFQSLKGRLPEKEQKRLDTKGFHLNKESRKRTRDAEDNVAMQTEAEKEEMRRKNEAGQNFMRHYGEPEFDDPDDDLDAEFGTSFMEMGPNDPALDHLAASEEATPEEMGALADTMVPALEFLYGEGLPQATAALKKAPQLYLTASEMAFEVLKKQYMNNPETPSSVYFGQDGAIQQTVDAMFDIAQAGGAAGARDRDQYAAALVNTWRLAGQYIADSGDQDAMAQAEELMMNVVLTDEDGQVMESTEQANVAAVERYAKKNMEAATQDHMQSLVDPNNYSRV